MNGNKVKIAIAVVGVLVLLIIVVVIIVMTTSGSASSPRLEIIGIDKNLTFIPGSSSSYKIYSDRLVKFMEPYEKAKVGGNVINCDEKSPKDDEVCLFQAVWLDTCSKSKEWGLSNSAPCVLLTYRSDETPDVYKSVAELPEDMPIDLKEVIETEDEFLKIVWVFCTNGIAYAPIQGFPPYYFPSKDTDDYLPPIVAVTFDLTSSSKIDVECSIWSKPAGKTDEIKFTIVKNGP